MDAHTQILSSIATLEYLETLGVATLGSRLMSADTGHNLWCGLTERQRHNTELMAAVELWARQCAEEIR